MVKLYKYWRDKAETIGWGVDPAIYHYIANKLLGPQTIREVLISRCSWYYKFEAIMDESPNIVPPYLINSENPD